MRVRVCEERERDGGMGGYIPLTRAMRARKATRMHSTLHASLPPLKAPAAAAPITGLTRRRTKTELSQATGNKNHLEVDEVECRKKERGAPLTSCESAKVTLTVPWVTGVSVSG